jgi:hypothetical protein
MRVHRLMSSLCVVYSISMLTGCGETKTEIPTNLKQGLPPAPTATGGGAKKIAGPPAAKAD